VDAQTRAATWDDRRQATAWITKSPIPETSTADLRATIQLQIGGELRNT
jgi:hypothetical protein